MNAAGVAILVRKNHIRYQQPALLGEELEIRTWASDVRRSTAVRYYHIHRPGVAPPIVEVHALGVWVDLKTGRPRRWPEAFMHDFKENIG
jgi:YbgC/YbaW family acyl-CoA thioester hydrolase